MKVRAGGLAVLAAIARRGVAGAAARGEEQASCGTVTLNEQAWAGSTANTYVAKNVLEQSLGCKVNITKIAEVPVYQAMADGKTDAVLEDWGHVAAVGAVRRPSRRRSCTRAQRRHGLIGWDIPTYLMKQHPEFKTWKGLKGKESLFKSPESGSQGMFLGGDPSYSRRTRR